MKGRIFLAAGMLFLSTCNVWAIEKTTPAIDNLVKVFEQNPSDAQTTVKLLEEMRKQGLSGQQEVINRYPGSEEARVALQDLKSVYIDMNDVDAYVAYVNSLGGNIHININEQDSLTYIAAEKLFLRGDNEGARRSMQNYLTNYPDGAFSINANFYLASIAFTI